MTLGTFTPRSRVAGDKLDLRQQWVYNRPYLVQPVEYSDSFQSKMANNGQGATIEAVWFDLMDVQTGQVLINVLTTSGALVDNFKSAVGSGTVLPLKLTRVAGGKFGGYAAPVELEPAEMAAANQAYNNWGMVAQERARREQAAVAAAGNTGFGGQPQQGFQQQAPQNQGGMFGGQAPQQNQGGFGAPASRFEQPGGQPQWGNQQPNQAPAQGGGFGGQVPQQGFQQQAPAQQGQFGGQVPAQGFGNPGPANDPSQGQFGQQAPQGGQFGGAPAQQGFQQNQGQFGQPTQDPNQGQFQQPAPGQNNPAAQAALNQLNSGQFQ
jgi:hypothetical protein